MAAFYRERGPHGGVALVLGAGNVNSIPPLDALYRLIARGQVVLLKMNPVNDYLGAAPRGDVRAVRGERASCGWSAAAPRSAST